MNEKTKEFDQDRVFNDKLSGVVAQMRNAPKFKHLITVALHDVMEWDIAFEASVSELKLKDTAKLIEWDRSAWIARTKEKFSELMLIDRLISAVGMTEYRDDILRAHIAKAFLGVQKKEDTSKMIEKLIGRKVDK
jgi:hypothetical protein